MSKYALTEQERKWLEERRTKEAPCGACWRWCSKNCGIKNGQRTLGVSECALMVD